MIKRLATAVARSDLLQFSGVMALSASVMGCAPSAAPPSSPMPPYATATAPPFGFFSFCLRDPAQCQAHDSRQRIALTQAAWDRIAQVNSQVNDAIMPESDKRHYDRAEYWNIPTDGHGDCEDYALAKRAELIAQGFPESALRIAVAMAPSQALHAVLLVGTDRGDYVLDNDFGDVMPWRAMNYVWMKEQSPDDPRQWIAMLPLQQLAALEVGLQQGEVAAVGR